MSKRVTKIESENWDMDVEVIDSPPTEIVEENVYVDESSLKNKSLIRVDMNIIQFPIFSKNTKRKVNQIVKYYFNKNRDTSIIVSPKAGDHIPGETEEKIFIALMQIMKEKGMPKKFIVSAVELKNKINFTTSKYNSVVSKSLSRLASTNYVFNNTLYSSEAQGVLEEKIETSIFNIRTISLSKKENVEFRKNISDKRIKEIYEIEVSDHFYKNIIQKGYMVYNGDTLLKIETSTARTLYMLIEKLRFDNLYLKLDTIFLIKRIPLKFERKNLSQTMKTLEKAFDELIEEKLILDFKFIKESTWEKSEVEIFFPEEANDDKQGRFFKDRNELMKMFSNITLSNTVHEMIEEIELITPNNEVVEVTKEVIEKILNLMPSKAKTLKTMPKTIKEAIEQYGYAKVEAVSMYMKAQKVDKVRSYFLKALKNNWEEDYKPPIKPSITTQKQFSLPSMEEVRPQYDESLYKEFEALEESVKNGIETYAYKEYIKKCGMESKIQQLAFAGSRKKHICEFLEKYPEILGRLRDDKSEKEDLLLLDLDRVQSIIRDSIKMASMVNNYEELEKENLLIKILNELMPYIRNSNLTKEKLDEVLKRNTGF